MVYLDLEILIRNGRVVDGTGNQWFRANIGVSEGVIIKVSRLHLSDGDRVIDAEGLVVCPGFIDCHTHSDGTIFEHPRCESAVRQGITSQVTGECGSGLAPMSESYREEARKILQRHSRKPEEVVVNWLTLEEWRSQLERQGIGTNIIPLAGHQTIRRSVLHPNKWNQLYMPNEKEIEMMKELTSSAMEDLELKLGCEKLRRLLEA